MSSSAEQLAANASWQTFARSKDLQARIWFTLGMLLIYRVGTVVPLPGIDIAAFQSIFANAPGIFEQINLFAGGALERMSIFMLSIFPYISASIIMQLMRAVFPTLDQLQKEGESGRRQVQQYTRYLTVIIAMGQSLVIGIALQGLQTSFGQSMVTEPGVVFLISTTVTLTAGTVFLMWLGEQITARGIGNGISLLIFVGIVASFPATFGSLFADIRQGDFIGSALPILAVIVGAIALLVLIVFVERAIRKVPIIYPQRMQGGRQTQAEQQFLPLKLNTAGVIPAIFAFTLSTLPLSLGQLTDSSSNPVLVWFSTNLAGGSPLYYLFFGGMVAFFCFFYTAIVFNPEDTAENLRNSGAVVAGGIRPGKQTAAYLDFILSRLTVIGAAYLVFVVIVPEVARYQGGINIFLGGTSLLIVVSVTIDTVNQVQSHLVAQQYESLIQKSLATQPKRRDSSRRKKSRR